MSNFPLVKYSAIDTWIPETDIDGVDAKEPVIADIYNMEYNNGFFENMPAPTSVNLPINVTADLAFGYTLMSSRIFRHSTQGVKTVYVMWKSGILRIYLDNILLNLDENGYGVAFGEQPHDINYNLVNDQLKINLNCNATLLGQTVILNMTLLYLDEVVYITGTTTFSNITFVGSGVNNIVLGGAETDGTNRHYEITIHDVAFGTPDIYIATYSVDGVPSGEDLAITADNSLFTLWTGVTVLFPTMAGLYLNDAWTFLSFVNNMVRPEGWHICPRWLGWAQKNKMSLSAGATYVDEVTEDFEDATYITGFNLGDTVYGTHKTWLAGTVSYHGKCMYCIPAASASDFGIYVATLGSLRNVRKIKFKLSSEGAPVNNDASFSVAVGSFDNNVYEVSGIELVYNTKYKEIEIDLNIFDDTPQNIWFKGWIAFGGSTAKIIVDDITIYSNDVIMVGLYGDGQRALLQEDMLGIYGSGLTDLYMQFESYYIDWRIVKYEIYAELDGVYVLVGDVDVDGAGWTYSGVTLTKDVNALTEDDVTYHNTLSANYNLPAYARVDNEKIIKSELAHKGRTYFVNGDYKVYQSHILGNLAIQADSFPYDEETGFGYFVVDNSKYNIAIANSPTNDMIIITNTGIFIYYIQTNGTVTLKQLRMGSGSVTISSLDSLSVDINGQPTTDGLFWIDDNGIYLYFGGIQPPENLITLTHKKYWEAISSADKANAVALYNPARKEYWLTVGSTTLIYELPFKKFRRTTPLMTEYMGIDGDGYPRYRYGTTIFIVKPNATKLDGAISTHYNICAADTEMDYKILQELYLAFGTSTANKNIYISLYLDDYYVGAYLFNTNKRYDKWLPYAGMRFNRIKMVVTVFTSSSVRIKEFGLLYTLDDAEPLGKVVV